MREACEREIRELHHFFEQWFRGDVQEDDTVFARLADVLAPSFQLISPRGAILEGVRGAHGKRGADFRIRIEAVDVRVHAEPLCLVTYEEHQKTPEGWTGRLSSALFQQAPDSPCGVQWLHLQETWLPGEG